MSNEACSADRTQETQTSRARRRTTARSRHAPSMFRAQTQRTLSRTLFSARIESRPRRARSKTRCSGHPIAGNQAGAIRAQPPSGRSHDRTAQWPAVSGSRCPASSFQPDPSTANPSPRRSSSRSSPAVNTTSTAPSPLEPSRALASLPAELLPERCLEALPVALQLDVGRAQHGTHHDTSIQRFSQASGSLRAKGSSASRSEISSPRATRPQKAADQRWCCILLRPHRAEDGRMPSQVGRPRREGPTHQGQDSEQVGRLPARRRFPARRDRMHATRSRSIQDARTEALRPAWRVRPPLTRNRHETAMRLNCEAHLSPGQCTPSWVRATTPNLVALRRNGLPGGEIPRGRFAIEHSARPSRRRGASFPIRRRRGSLKGGWDWLWSR